MSLLFADEICMLPLLEHKRGASRVEVECSKRSLGDGAASSSAAEVVNEGVGDTGAVKLPPKKPRAATKRGAPRLHASAAASSGRF